MGNTALNRSSVQLLTNKSGGAVSQGGVVVIDTTTAASFTTTTTEGYIAQLVGVVIEPNGIANNSVGLVAFGGYVPKINLDASASLGDFVKTDSVAGQGTPHATPAVSGDFAQVLGTGTTPAAILFGVDMAIGSGGGGGDSTYTNAYASRPAASNDGDLFFPSDGFQVERDTGAAWVPWGPLFPLTAPPTTGWSWVNQGTASVSESSKGIFLSTPADNTTSNWRIRTRSYTAPLRAEALVLFTTFLQENYHGFMIGFRESSSGALSGIRYLASNELDVSKYTNPTTFSANYVDTGMLLQPYLFFAIEDNNTNRICEVSQDGQNWQQLHSIGRTDFLTPDQMFFSVHPRNATWGCGVTLISWKTS